MPAKSSDQEMLGFLSQKPGIQIDEPTFDKNGNLIGLQIRIQPKQVGDLYEETENQLVQLPPELWQFTALQGLGLNGNQLTQLPPEVGQLTALQMLDLRENRLTQLPPEVCQLTALQRLNLARNQLTQLPPEVGQLTALQRLYLGENQLTQLPPEVGQLTALQEFDLGGNQLTQLPPEVGQLTALQELDLGENQLTQLPPEVGQLTALQELDLGGNQLTQLPPEVGQLTALQRLGLGGNQLTQSPPEVGQLTALQELYLGGNQLTQLPPEVGQLTALQRLGLGRNQLTQLPPEVGQLTALQTLDLGGNQLTQLPPEVCQLTALQELDLGGNQLTQLPPEVGQLTALQRLGLGRNQLTQLLPEVGQLTTLATLDVGNNPRLLTPPPEIIAHGSQAILTFLRALQKDHFTRYEAKLLVVGEGGTGKSSLLRSLQHLSFDLTLPTTHGVEVGQLSFPHPRHPQTNITLNTWDFGGQHIYQATHQFFLTKRSLYLVVWNARLGAEAGKLDFWLETIRALALDAPVLLVATHIDERAPDLNYQHFKDTYPQIVGSIQISNKDGRGIAELAEALAQHAANIHLMGQPWPTSWMAAERQLLARPEHHINTSTYLKCCRKSKVDEEIAKGTLGNYLHDLGKILYFRDDPLLSHLVVLKPNWITKAISRVLTDEPTIAARGILPHQELARIWASDEDGQRYDPDLYPIFLRLMERFDLSYQLEPERPGGLPTHSLIPQLLPYAPPAEIPPWPSRPLEKEKQLEMRYGFSFVPAGILPWFIVRTHQYTQHLHWREGVILRYQEQTARVELNSQQRLLRLAVRGTQPYNFFTILMNTLNRILERFEGLQVRREIPCTCHWQSNGQDLCPRFYLYEDLERRMEAGKHDVECPESFLSVSVPELLYGIHISTHEQVWADIQESHHALLQSQEQVLHQQEQILYRLAPLSEFTSQFQEIQQGLELIWRGQLRQWNLEMQKLELECPNVFFLTFGRQRWFNPKNWVSQEYRLILLCQHPQDPHPVGAGYSLRKSDDWWKVLAPGLTTSLPSLKLASQWGN